MQATEESKAAQQAPATNAEEEKKAEEEVKVGPKHAALADATNTETEAIQNRHTRNILSPFINQKRSWEDEGDFEIPPELIRGIVDELGFIKPSKIQAVAIPLIMVPNNGVFHDLIAQSKNGSGKTGAFSVGSTLRVDPAILKPQVLVLAHVRELSSQIADVYTKLCKYTNIKVTNFTASGQTEGNHIVVTTLGKLDNNLKKRGNSGKLDLSALKCLVIDETDVFFGEQRNLNQLKEIHSKYIAKLPNKVQHIFFSATYTEEVKTEIAHFAQTAQQINLKNSQLSLDHIRQFEFRCQPGKKPEFLQQVFNVCEMTQTVIFVNTRQYADRLHQMMRRNNYKSTIIFGDMSPEERDEMIAKFRSGEVSVIITTNMLARGVDVPEIQIVINFDVPTQKIGRTGERHGDAENYLHRIGRTGRFGTLGIAVSIYDRDEDKRYLDEILDHYSMRDKMNTLESPDHLRTLLEQIREDTI